MRPSRNLPRGLCKDLCEIDSTQDADNTSSSSRRRRRRGRRRRQGRTAIHTPEHLRFHVA